MSTAVASLTGSNGSRPRLSGQRYEEALRRAHVGHEVLVRSLGTLWAILGSLGLGASIATFVAALGEVEAGMVAIGFGELAAGGVLLRTGILLRSLEPDVWTSAVVVASVGIFALPFVTLAAIVALWLLTSAKGKTVLSYDYHTVVKRTPHIRTDIPVGFWIGVLAIGGLHAASVWWWFFRG